MKNKKLIALVLTVMMVVSVLSACGKTEDPPVSSNTTTATAPSDTASTQPTGGPDISKPVKLKWMYIGNTVTDDSKVMEGLNAYLKDKINASLEMTWCGWGADFDDRVMLAIQTAEDYDIYFTCSWTSNNFAIEAKKGSYAKLDDLLTQYTPNLFKELHPVLTEAAKTEGPDGKIATYAIPSYKEIAQVYTWDLNMNMLEKYGYSENDITNYYELGPIFEKIKAGEGKDFFPFNYETGVTERVVNNNDIVDSELLLSYEFDPVNPGKSGTKIVSKYETAGYEKFVKQSREYYLKGYIDPQMSNVKASMSVRENANLNAKYAIGVQSYSPGYEYENSDLRKTKVVYKKTHTPIIGTTSSRGAMNAISVNSKNPDRALMLLNLVNTDPKVYSFLAYGAEGVHYQTQADGSVKLDPAMQDTFRVWRAGLGKLTILPRMSTEPENIWQLFDEFNNGAQALPILGWSFDPKPVTTELAALNSIKEEYAISLNCGAVDPAVKLPEFISKLKANGIDKVVAEAQKQLDTYLASKK